MNPYRSELTADFVKLFRKLPTDVRRRAQVAYRRWRENPNLPGLHFKRVWASAPIFSVRIDSSYRVVGRLEDSLIKWDFIGNHVDYIRYLSNL